LYARGRHPEGISSKEALLQRTRRSSPYRHGLRADREKLPPGTLDRFIANPDQMVPGHSTQPYGGDAPPKRASIIDYLEESVRNRSRRSPNGVAALPARSYCHPDIS
jgi:hypothetical protein